MSFDQRQFRNALSQFATGVTIITTRSSSGIETGITASSFNSVSLDPPLILWSLGKDSGSFDAFQSATHFGVHILGETQADLSQRFATLGGDKFKNLKTTPGLAGIPLLNDCPARFQCSVFERIPAGDHIIYLGKVEEMSFAKGQKPLVYHGGGYARLEAAASIA